LESSRGMFAAIRLSRLCSLRAARISVRRDQMKASASASNIIPTNVAALIAQAMGMLSPETVPARAIAARSAPLDNLRPIIIPLCSSANGCAHCGKKRSCHRATSRSAPACCAVYISRVENGHTVPAVETLEKFAHALEVPLYQFFYEGKESPALPAAIGTTVPNGLS